MGITSIINKVQKEYKVLKGDAAKDKLFSSQQEYLDGDAAAKAFARSKEKLFDVQKWSNLPGPASAGFVIYNSKGLQKLHGSLEVNDYLYIDLPGPDPDTWVKVIKIEEGQAEAYFTVRPSPDPRDKGRESEKQVEHFFSDTATSTFKVELVGNTLYAYEIGKNEKPNNRGKKAGNLGVVNTIVSSVGWAIFQKMQWEKLTDYLVHKIEIEIKK